METSKHGIGRPLAAAGGLILQDGLQLCLHTLLGSIGHSVMPRLRQSKSPFCQRISNAGVWPRQERRYTIQPSHNASTSDLYWLSGALGPAEPMLGACASAEYTTPNGIWQMQAYSHVITRTSKFRSTHHSIAFKLCQWHCMPESSVFCGAYVLPFCLHARSITHAYLTAGLALATTAAFLRRQHSTTSRSRSCWREL